jgi:hypothetical protein
MYFLLWAGMKREVSASGSSIPCDPITRSAGHAWLPWMSTPFNNGSTLPALGSTADWLLAIGENSCTEADVNSVAL